MRGANVRFFNRHPRPIYHLFRPISRRFNHYYQDFRTNVNCEVRCNVIPLISSTNCSERQGLYANDDRRVDVGTKRIKDNASAASSGRRVRLIRPNVRYVRNDRCELLRLITLRRNKGGFHARMRPTQIILRLVTRVTVANYHDQESSHGTL